MLGLGVAASAAIVVRCLAPTEITLRITTNIPCASLDHVAVIIGTPSDLETRPPTAVTTTCDQGNIGTLVVTPSDVQGSLGISVIAGTIGPPDVVAENCRAAGYANCVVARRVLSFIPHTPLTLPIELDSACVSFPCVSDATMTRTCIVISGQPQCVNAKVPDPSECVDASGTQCEPTGDGSVGVTDAGALDASPPGTVIGLAAGGNSTCAHVMTPTQQSQWWCWGQNDKGQLSFDTGGAPVMTPVHATSLDNFKGVAVGVNHGCGVDGTGAAECWGDNTSGQLGDGTNLAHAQPKAVGYVASAIQVGDDFSCAVNTLADGGAFSCWGGNATGQLGIGSVASTHAPTLSQSPFDEVATGAAFACALSSGAVSCWGDNSLGQIDQAVNIGFVTSPNPIGIDGSLLAIGSYHGCVSNGVNLTCWGDNDKHQASASDAAVVPAVTSQVSAKVGAVSAGRQHTCVLDTAKAANVMCVGDNTFGQLGNGGAPATTLTTAGVTAFMNSLATGYDHTCASNQTSVYCWGNNASGQLGDGTNTQRASPVIVLW